MTMARRDKREIVLSILEFCKDEPGSHKTKIIDGTGLNFNTGNRYLDLLAEKDVLQKEDGGYTITDKGISMMEACRRILECLYLDKLNFVKTPEDISNSV